LLYKIGISSNSRDGNKKTMHKEPNIIRELKVEESKKYLINLGDILKDKPNIDEIEYLDFPRELKNLDSNINLLKTYKLIIENSSIAIMFTNHEEKIIFLNDHTEKLLNFKKTDLLIRHLSSVFPPDEWKKIHFYNISKKGGEYHFETKMLKKNGLSVDIDLSLNILKNKEGKTIGSIGIIRDISDYKKRELNFKIKDYAILSTINAICFTNMSFVITYVNPSFLRMWQYDSERYLIGKSLLNICKFKENFLEKINDANENDFWSGELLAEGNSGRLFALQTEITLLKNKNNIPNWIMISFLDITQKKRMQKKLEIKNEEIRQLLIQKDEFINQLGHDLKNPLNPLLNLLPILYNEENNAERKKIISILNKNVKYMKDLVCNMINLAKLNSSNTQFNFEFFNFNTLVKETIDNNLVMFKEKNIAVKNNTPKNIKIKTDRIKMLELLNNILSNSVKYSNDYGKITISTKKKKNFLEVSINDNGVGMNDEQLKQIFDEFYKGDLSRHNFESSGLGLAICKRIVEKHGGKIWANSPGINKGSTISFTIRYDN